MAGLHMTELLRSVFILMKSSGVKDIESKYWNMLLQNPDRLILILSWVYFAHNNASIEMFLSLGFKESGEFRRHCKYGQ
jgi:hypothetical protein